ncbi:adenylyl cyclase-associated protein 1-like isoform X1 [Vespa mandarinia]|uniref:adenylyl cyclase-associated protein 1-like isoform X1 n=2 Tax=Vespa mandarinia TaxID=7446 RepID=UPI0016078D19|nr:adenylyl cyclase-associated protein 1-like isoform X1 [Vespa mandarinia]
MFKCCVCNKSSRKEKVLGSEMTSNKSSGNKIGDSSIKIEDEMREEMKEKANGEIQRCEKEASSLLENHVVSSEKLTTGNDEKEGKIEKAERIEKDEGGMLEHEEGMLEETNRERDSKGTTKGTGNAGKDEEEDGGGDIGGVETTIPSSATSIKVVVKSNLYNGSGYIERTIDDGPEEEGDDSVFESCPNENENDNENETTGKATTVSAIPRWLSEEEEADPGSEGCSGMQEPPATPVARDELALRRHRFFSDLLQATQNSSEHRVRFDPLGPMVHAGCEANDREEHLEDLVNRLENVTKRLERVPAQSAIAQTQETAVQTNTPSPKKPQAASTRNTAASPLSSPEKASLIRSINGSDNMSIAGYENLLAGSVKEYLQLSQKIGGDVATHSEMVEKAFQIQLGFIQLAASRSAPTNQSEQMSLLAPTSAQIQQIQEFSEKNRNSAFFNHLAAISGSIPALGWVAVSPTPAPYVKEMNDAGQFYTNRVLKDWKEKDKTHVDWCKAWVQALTDLQQYVRQHHTTGLVWAKSGSAPVGIPPPPPPSMPLPDVSALNVSDDRSALFAEINQGEGITKNLKKVTSDMQTHKNPSLRTGPAPFKAPVLGNAVPAKSVPPANVPIDKPPVFTKDGKKWLVEYHKGNKDLLVDNVEMNNVVYMFRCQDSTMVVKGKVNSIVMDSCRKSSVVFDSVVSSIEFVNCQSVQMQVLGKVPTISIDKTDGCQMYLNSESLDVELITSKSSEMNVMVPKGNGDYTEYPVPEQFKTTISPKGLSTIAVDSLG